jgi:hypothetical protein
VSGPRSLIKNRVMKILLFSIVTVIFNFVIVQDKVIYKDYVGGVEGRSYFRLKLYDDSTYSYLERYDFPGVLRDTGKWILIDDRLVLKSKERNKDYGNRKLFKADSFQVKDNNVIIYSVIKDKESNKLDTLYRTLRERDVKD